MIFSTNSTEQRIDIVPPEHDDPAATPSLVILHPLSIYADAIQTVIHSHSRWRVAGTTSDIDEAVAMAATADAIVFDTRWGTVAEISRVARRLRQALPGVSLVLLTRHEGTSFLRRAAHVDMDAVAHLCESIVTVRSALDAAESGNPYRSPLIAARVTRTTARRGKPASALEETRVDPLRGGKIGWDFP